MSEDRDQAARNIADRVLEFADELEASGEISIAKDALESARAALHAWVDDAIGFVATPAFGRVTVIHPDGQQSTIASPDLPYSMSAPVRAVATRG